MTDPLLASLECNHHGRRLGPKQRFWFSIVEDREPPMIADIQRAVADRFGVELRDLKSNNRFKEFILPRHIAMYLCRRLTIHSNQQISRLFNMADHTTMSFAFRKIERLVKTDSVVAGHVAVLEAGFQ